MRFMTLPIAGICTTLMSCAGATTRRGNELVATQLQCPIEQVTLTPAPDPRTPAKAEGCGKVDYAISHCISAQGASGSAHSCKLLWFSSAVDQAAFTTKCPKDQVTTEWFSPNLGVDACGERMTFTPTLSGWMLNSASSPSGT